MKIVAVVAGLVLAVCLALFFSNRGMLVWSTAPDNNVGTLKCQYFTGFGIIERSFLYTKQGFLGRDTCPRFLELQP